MSTAQSTTQINCFWGPAGTGKTEAIIARMTAAAEQGKKSIAFVGDGSAVAYEASGLVDAGFLTVVQYSTWDFPFSVCKWISEGWLPINAADPKSKWTRIPADVRYGVIGIEGMAVMGTYLLGNRKGGLAYRAAQGEKIGPDAAIRIKDVERDPKTGLEIPGTGTGEAFGNNGLAHYGMGQGHVVGYVQSSAMLPADEVIWTSHERSTEDKISRKQYVGPEASGSAITTGLPRLFGHVLHFTTATKRARGTTPDAHTGKTLDDLDVEYRIYTRNHIAVDGASQAEYMAITRGVSADEMPHYLTAEKPGLAIMAFFQKVEALRAERAARFKALAAQMPKVVA